MPTPLKVLILEDRESDAKLILRALRQAGYEPQARRVDNEADFIGALEAKPDVVLADYNLPQFSGPEALQLFRQRDPDTPFILVSGTVGEETAVESMRLGANDYVMKDKLLRLGPAVERELREAGVRRERRALEGRVAEAEARFRALVERSQEGVGVLDQDGRFTYASPPMERIFGCREGEIIGCKMVDFIPPDDVVLLQEEVADLMQRPGGALKRELRFAARDGVIRWFDTTVTNLIHIPSLRGLVANFRDITERKLAEGVLREQNEILANAHEGVMIVNLANEITLWNRGAEQIFGWTAAETLGRRSELLLGLDKFGQYSAARAAVERAGFWNGELQTQTRDGRRLIVDCRITLVRDEAGRPRAQLNFLTDITEKKVLEEKFLHAQRLESLGMLAAGVAHDLNNILAPIVFAAPLLRESLSTPRDLKILDILAQSGNRGAGLVKQILGFVHSNAGELQPTQVKHIARDIVDIAEQTFPKTIQIEAHIPSDLWPVQGNATQIHQVLLNLCVNARDAMPHGGSLGVIASNRRLDAGEADAIPGGRPGAWLVLEVSDTGSGIPPEVLERIWQPFFTTKGPAKGTGLGLSTVRGIVASHHGFIELKTEVGRGTTLRVFLPALEIDSPHRRSTSPLASPEGHGEFILVVDDDPAIRDVVTAVLGRHGYRVVACGDGVEAIALFSARPGEISLVVTDVDMPRLGGLALARALLEIRPELKVLAMSGLSRSRTEGSDLPDIQKFAYGFLLKPFNPDVLLGAVHGLLHPADKGSSPDLPSS